ncbi:MAG: hypothetical protein ACRDPS_02700 [Nocardioides sp.]|uniref:hypothetical protein n=1 Tax=Nocardioides sp. TaxID=35761 RepID=UPI003D6B2754
MTTSRTLGIAVLALTTVVTFAGCGSQDPDPSEDPTIGQSAGGQTSEPAIPSDWQEAKIDVASVHVPQDWAVLNPKATDIGFTAPKDEFGFSPGGGSMVVNVGDDTGDAEAIIDAATEFNLKTYKGDPNISNVKRLPDLTISGVPFSLVQWETSQSWETEYLTATDDGTESITLSWQFIKSDIDRKGSQDLIDPVMETFELL